MTAPARGSARVFLLLVIVAAIAGFFILDLDQQFSLSALRSQLQALTLLIAGSPVVASLLYFALYLAMAAFSLPGATLMTLAGGALFGVLWGVFLVSFASALGATLALLVSRYLFRDSVQRHYGRVLDRVDAGIRRDGAVYLASIRLVPAIPFFVVNLAMGLTAIRPWTFYWVSQLAMLPATLVYVNAGTQLAQIDSVGGILSRDLLLSFGLLALLPLLARLAAGQLRRSRRYAGWTRPKKFDYNLLVIGAGSGGLVAAYIAAAVKARVGLVESGEMGGDCLNTGCVPSKALIKSSRIAQSFREADRFGLEPVEPELDFSRIMTRVQQIVAEVAPHDSQERYRALGVNCMTGTARFIDPWTVGVNAGDGSAEQRVTARSIVIATGARPLVPQLEGIEAVEPLTSETVWALRERPRRLLVLGGGPVGCELAQAFSRLGCAVTQVERGDRLLSKEDPDVSAAVLAQFEDEGIDVRLGHEAQRFTTENGEKVLYAAQGEKRIRIAFDQVLVALGRKPNTSGLNLGAIGIEPETTGRLKASDDMSVGYPHIFACGDVVGPFQFTHSASYQAWFAAVNGLFGNFKRFRVDYSVMPWVTFTSPEVGRVGLSETQAREQNIGYEVTRYDLAELDRAIAESSTKGFIKILTAPGKDRILGAVVVGEHAGELLGELILAMKQGIGLNRILGTTHPYPTWNEAIRACAGRWKQAHAPKRVLGWLERYHRFRL